MANSQYVRSAFAQAVLTHVPSMVRDTLLEDSEFCQEYDLWREKVLSFKDLGISIQRSYLFDAIRRVLSGTAAEDVIDEDGEKWTLKKSGESAAASSFVLSREGQSIALPIFDTLSPDIDTRLSYFDQTISDVWLPTSVHESWRETLGKRALDDDEFDELNNEILDTPIRRAQAIRNELTGADISVSSVVPSSRRYYERLIGDYDGSTNISEYVANSCKSHMHRLTSWNNYDGFLYCLYLSSHQSITQEIDVEGLSSSDMERAFEFLAVHGDRISQLGAIDVGLRILSQHPNLKDTLLQLLHQIRDDNVSDRSSGFKLLSASFMLVDGELSRARLFSSEPPFYRRLAALSQAALICRQFGNSVVDCEKFYEFAVRNCGEQFSMQSLVDMRQEPRWLPSFASAAHMKADFLGRIMIAAKEYEDVLIDGGFDDLASAIAPGSLLANCDPLHVILPGPLEGSGESQNIMPSQFADTIGRQLSSDEVGPSSFIALVNSALIYRIDRGDADLAAKALKIASYRLARVENRTQLLKLLSGLATVAAVTRCSSLADELRVLTRKYRNDPQYAISTIEAFDVGLTAAASRSELHEWIDFVGAWLTELAFGELDDDDGKLLHSHLLHLCHVVPDLWETCGRADAALMAYNAN